MENAKITSLYDLSHTMAADYLKGFTYPWEALKGISDMMAHTTALRRMFGYTRLLRFSPVLISALPALSALRLKFATVHSSEEAHWLEATAW